MSTAPELNIEPRCPDCGRLSVDNPQHCPEKSPLKWAVHCQWKKCSGLVKRPTDGASVRCGRVYGRPGWPGFKGGTS